MSALLHDSFASGYLLDHYTLLERIGVGGQATVWSAWDDANARVVAIKIIPTGESDTTTLPQTAMKEALLVSRLQHPHILPLHDFKFSPECRYLVMRYVSGGTLADMIKQGALAEDKLFRVAGQLASALDYLHAQGIVHRDLKPSNLLFDAREHGYLADFGLAKDLSEAALQLHTGRGTPPYAPPEQHTFSAITPQSDIYSFGVMLYEMFTGKLPWNGDLSLATRQITNQEEMPDPRATNPHLPKGLVDALRIITAADPIERPASAKAALWLLEEVFGREHQNNDTQLSGDERASMAQDAHLFIRRALITPDHKLSLTQYRHVESVYGRDAEQSADEAIRQFLLRGALIHGHNQAHWLEQVHDRAVVIRTCEGVIQRESEGAAGRAAAVLLRESSLGLQPETAARLVEMALGLATQDSSLRGQAFDVLERTAPGAGGWREVAFSPEIDARLAQAALGQSGLARRAARLIGRIRSMEAVNTLIQGQGRYRPDLVLGALLNIRQAAGSLPASVPAGMRAQISIEALRRDLVARPGQLVKAYIGAALGGLLAFGGHVYLTYRLPQILDATRILVALQHGVFLGVLVGAGVFASRVIGARLRTLPAAARVIAGAVIGGLIINLSLVAYHLLMLNSAPVGGLLVLGSLVIAGAVALGSAIHVPKVIQVAISAGGIMTALWGTWALHLQSNQVPILMFDYDWSGAQIAAVMLGVSLLLAGMVQAINLEDRERLNVA